MCLCLRVWKNCSILTSNLNISAPDHLVQMNIGSLSTLGCRLWYWCQNSCHQLSSAVNSCQLLFFMSQSLKIYIKGLLCKSLLGKLCLKFSDHWFGVLKRFCSSKTHRVKNFWLSSLENFFWKHNFFGQLILANWSFANPFIWTIDFWQLNFLPD